MLTFKFKADGSQYARGLDQMRQQTKQWSSSVKGMIVGAFIGGAAINALKQWIDGLDRIGKLSARLGKSAESIQRVGHAAELAGSNVETVANALTKVEQNAGGAITGLSSMQDAFDRLGINARDFIDLEPEEQIIELSKAYQKAQESGTGMADILLILGGRAKELLPLLSQAPEDLQAAFDEAAVAGDEVIRKAELLNDTFTRIKNSISGFLADLIEALMVAGADIAAWIDKAVNYVGHKISGLADKTKVWGEIIGNALTGDFDGVKDSYAKLEKISEETAKNIQKQFDRIDIQNDLAVRAALGEKPGEDDSKKGLSEGETEALIAAEKKKKDIKDKILKLSKEIKDQEQKAAFEALTLEEKKLALVEKRKALEKEAEDAPLDDSGTLTALENEREILEINKQIDQLDEKAAKQAEKAKDKIQKLRDQDDKEKEDLNKREAEVDERNMLRGMTDEEKLSYKKRKQQQLLESGHQEYVIEGKEMQGEIDSLMESISDAKNKRDKSEISELETADPSQQGGVDNLVASTLQAIGGGGGVSALGDPMLGEAKQTNAKLDKLIENTQPAGGQKNIEI